MRIKFLDNYYKYLSLEFDKFSWEQNVGLFLCFLVVFSSLLLFVFPIVIIVRADFGPTYALLTFVAWGSIEFFLFSFFIVSYDVARKKLFRVFEKRRLEKNEKQKPD